jgi:hypothetical protein
MTRDDFKNLEATLWHSADTLNREARKLEKIINYNILQLTGEE